MKKTHSLLFFFLFLLGMSQAQTFTSIAGGPIPDAGPVTSFPLNVTGLSPSTIDTVFGLETVCIYITHTWDADLSISLQSPDGTIVSLSSGNGGDGDGYYNTCFNNSASTSILSGGAPFTGTFKPMGSLGIINNGQSGNGTWNLLVQDGYGADTGSVIHWSLTFGNSPAKPFLFPSSNLPIVVLNTFGAPIPDEPKINAFMGIIYNGPGLRNYITDPFNNYKNRIGIERRGSTSGGFPQKSYGIETRNSAGVQNDTMVLGMPSEHDWILSGPYDDKTCMRNVLSYDIANKTGHYASRTFFCEVMLNGQYQGIYIFMEKIKRDPARVNISKLTAADTTGDQLTGGYIIKIDKNTGSGGSAGWNSSIPSGTGSTISYLYDYPSELNIQPAQKNYIAAYVDSFEVALNGINFADPSTGYRHYIDVPSFIDYFILNEVSKNVDGYRLSTYLNKDKQSKGGKLFMGPAWDYNLGWWNADYCGGDQSTGWAYDFGSVCSGDPWQVPFWWGKLLQDPVYAGELKCRWTELRQSTLSVSVLNNFVDSVATYLYEAQARHFTAWPILGVYTWPNPSPLPTSYPGEISALKSWINNRIAWLDANMPGICTAGVGENGLNSNNVLAYPNPFSSEIQLDIYLSQAENLQIEVYSSLGSKILELPKKEYMQGVQHLDLGLDASLPNGIYFLTIRTETSVVTKKITK